MDPFINLPNELITRICNETATPDLLRLSQTSSRIYQVCSDIINERKIESQVNLLTGDFRFYCSYLNRPNLDVLVIFRRTPDESFQIEQIIMGDSDMQKEIWIIPDNDPNYYYGYRKVIREDRHLLTARFKNIKQIYNRISVRINKNELPKILKFMYELGYSHIKEC